MYPLLHVKVVDSLDKPNASHLEQVVRVLPPVSEPLDDGEHQPQVPVDQGLSGSAVPVAAFDEQLPCLLAFQNLQPRGVYPADLHFPLHKKDHLRLFLPKVVFALFARFNQ